MLVSHLIQKESETGATRCPLAQQPILDGACYLNRQQKCQCVCDIFQRWLRRAGADKWFFHFSRLILDELHLQTGADMSTGPQIPQCVSGVSNPQTCGEQ